MTVIGLNGDDLNKLKHLQKLPATSMAVAAAVKAVGWFLANNIKR
jgi:hypothetical protein